MSFFFSGAITDTIHPIHLLPRARLWYALTETIGDAEMLYWLSNEPAGNATEPSAMETHRKFLLFTAWAGSSNLAP